MNRLDAFNARMTVLAQRAVSTRAGVWALTLTGALLLAAGCYPWGGA